MKTKRFVIPFVVLMVLALLVSACGTPAAPKPISATPDSQAGGGAPGQAGSQNPAAGQLLGAQPQVKDAPAQAGEAGVPPVPAPGEYPTSPEGVVQAFLASYEAQPDAMVSYLSQGQSAAVPADGAGALLGFTGTLEGFVIDAAAVNPQTPAAVVSAAVKVGGAEIRRTFTLGKEGDAWKIELIETQAN